jgi:hypothetical protein
METNLELETMHLLVGRGLSRMVSSAARSNDEKLVLLAASNLMRGATRISNNQERLMTMQLRLRAAILAALKASVDNAR